MKTNNEILSKALLIIADEMEQLGGDTQATAIREGAQRIEELEQKVSFSIEQFKALRNPELKAKHVLAREALSRLRSEHE